MIPKQTFPYIFIIEYDAVNTDADPDWLTALVHNVKYTIVNGHERANVFALENKVPKWLLARTTYKDTYGLIQYNKDVSYPYYDLLPRSNSFEVTLRGEIIWSRLATGEYPNVNYIRQRVNQIVRSEIVEDFMRLARARNIFQFIEMVRLPEEPKQLKELVSPELYAEYKKLQMKYQLRKYFQETMKDERDKMLKRQRDSIIN